GVKSARSNSNITSECSEIVSVVPSLVTDAIAESTTLSTQPSTATASSSGPRLSKVSFSPAAGGWSTDRCGPPLGFSGSGGSSSTSWTGPPVIAPTPLPTNVTCRTCGGSGGK